MYYAQVGKDGLLSWLGRKTQPLADKISHGQLDQLYAEEVGLLWIDKPSSFDDHPIVLVSRRDIEDFYAFVGTYVTTYRPFSAFFRVLQYENLLETFEFFSEGQINKNVSRSIIGVAIAEAYVQSRGRAKSIADITVAAVSGTLSATLTALVWRGGNALQIADVAARWQYARRLNADDALALNPIKIEEVWSIIAEAQAPTIWPSKSLERVRQNIVSAINAASHKNADIVECIYPLSARISALGNAALKMRGSREERVRVLKDALETIVASKEEDVLKEFLAGTFLSLVGNGSFDYLPLLSSLNKEMPSAGLWFGLMSSFQKNGDALIAGDCLGRRAVRDITTHVSPFALPRDDIALEELDVLSRSQREKVSFRTAHQAFVSVDLWHGISGKFRIGTSARSENHSQISVGDSLDHDVLRELRMTIDKAQKLTESLSQQDQKELFTSSDKRGRRKR